MRSSTLDRARELGCAVALRPDGLIHVDWSEARLSERQMNDIERDFRANRDLIAVALRSEQ